MIGAQVVASLRALHRSGRWDHFWQTHPQRRRPPHRPARLPLPVSSASRYPSRLTSQIWSGP